VCGFVGFWQARCEDSAAIAEAMSLQVRHRGPNSSGVWVDKSVGIAMGHRRLAILDVSDAGRQPMASVCGRWVIVFNGEIYNHLEIRRQLDMDGEAPSWRGHSDTETLLAAFTSWGIEATLKSTVGMFSLALWDRYKRSLILARDRMGEKPLYYGWQNNAFLFGSELKALRVHPEFRNENDSASIGLFLVHNYIPAPYSIYRGIFKLPAGTWLTLNDGDFKNRSLSVPREYWSLREVANRGLDSPFRGSITEAADELENLLVQAVRGQMLSDVPLGAFLSGGVDSATIVSLMQSQADQPIKTFTIGMPEKHMDESGHAAVVAKSLGTEHISHMINSDEALSIIPRLPEIWDEPFADSSQIPTWLVCHFACQHVVVALSGDGGDEQFFGYNRYRNLRLFWRARKLSKLPFEFGAMLYRRLSLPGARYLSPLKVESAAAILCAQSREEMIDMYSSPYRGETIPLIRMSDEGGYRQNRNWKCPEGFVDPAAAAAWRDASQYLPDDILLKIDRAAMSVSIETRAPFLDHRVVEFAWRLPVNYKLNGGESKRVLRRVLCRYLPLSLFNRPKQGFSIPVAKWLRNELRDWAEIHLDEKALEASGLNADTVRAYWSAHLAGEDYSERLWGVLMLQAFMKSE